MPTTKVLGIVSMVPMGQWNAGTTYQKLNLVRNQGVAYLAFGSSVGVEPGASENWEASWMPVVYDGGQVAPDGTYPQLTAGKVQFALLFGNKSYDGSSQQTITAEDLGIATVYQPQGGILFANLPATPSASNYGYVWNVTDSFTTDSRFIEGAGHDYAAGTSVGVIRQNDTYYYSVLGSLADLSDYAQVNGTYPGMTVGNSQNLNGQPASQYAQVSGNYANLTAGDSQQLGGVPADQYAHQDGTYLNMYVGDSQNLNGRPASDYVLKTDLPVVGNIVIYTKNGISAKYAVVSDIDVSDLP